MTPTGSVRIRLREKSALKAFPRVRTLSLRQAKGLTTRERALAKALAEGMDGKVRVVTYFKGPKDGGEGRPQSLVIVPIKKVVR